MEVRNGFRERLAAGGPAIGAVAKVPSPTLVEVYGDVGLDFVFLDYEHAGAAGPRNTAELENLVRAAERSGTDLLVRLPAGEPPLIREVLETGVRNVLVPRVRTAEEARRAVRAARYDYEGEPGDRGVGGTRANRWGAEFDGYLDREDDSTSVGVMLETAAAVENAADILAVSDLGFAFVGHRDLTHSLGHGEDIDHPDVATATDTLREACLDAAVPVGRVANDVADARAGSERGFDFFLVGYELDAVRTVFGEWVDAFAGGRA
jgi:2-dehydro-3-deoxyglucarate aldolase